MSVLSASTELQVEDKLVADGLIKRETLEELKAKAKHKNTPILSLLVSDGHISNEQLTKISAAVTKVPISIYIQIISNTHINK